MHDGQHTERRDEQHDTQQTDRRDFLGRVTVALAAATMPLTTLTAQPVPPRAEERTVAAGDDGYTAGHAAAAGPWDDSWLNRIHGKHRQFFDAASVNEGFPLLFAANFLNLYNEVYKIPDTDLTAVVGIRHLATPLAFTDAIWSKYKLGEFFKITDPKTKAPATRNIFLQEESMMFPGATIGALQKRGVIFTMCNVALTILSGMTAEAAGVPKEPAKPEWVAGLLPGVTLVPVGVMAVNRAQEKGCTYCYGGDGGVPH